MRYIRYYLYLLCMSLLFGGGLRIWKLLGDLLSRPVSFPVEGIVAAALFVLLPPAASLVNDWKNRAQLPPGVRTNHLRQEARASIKGDGITIADIQSAIYTVRVSRQTFIKDYEEHGYVAYKGVPVDEIPDGTRANKRQRINPVIVEVTAEDREPEAFLIVVHKEYQFSEFTNTENELALQMILEELTIARNGELTIG